tara:strand:+ start:26706 stop:34145 length:7440 start_codon:yes stop_codon:yes gene_type:complete
MPQKTNLNISPYYDDFDKADNFYKMLFKPGFPVQARELTGLQSILQNQVESFGSHIFKEGSMVIPGGVTYDDRYFSAKINPDHLGIDVTVYLDALVGKRIKGQNSKIIGKIQHYILPPDEGVEEITLFVRYLTAGSTSESNPFENGETLLLEENATYGNTTLNAGDSVASLVLNSACATGSSVGLEKGVYFIRGTFVDVPTTSIVLEPYNNTPSYRVGLDILEEVVTSNDDPSLNDNAKGFTNYAAPGADRFKISVKLSKKSLQDFEDTNFVELVRIDNGEIKKLQDKSVYSEIRKYFAKRTFEESGNYALKPFRVDVLHSLNDELGNGGLYVKGDKTEEGNDPSDNDMCVRVSSGTAYVKGFDVDLIGSTVLDVDKPRDIKEKKNALVPFKMGSMVKVNNVFGTPAINVGTTHADNVIELYSRRRDGAGTSGNVSGGQGFQVGVARAYAFNLADNTYSANESEFELYLFDVQTFITLTLSTTITGANNETPLSSRVRGLKSGATGYVHSYLVPKELRLVQTSGTFIRGEQLIFNEKTTYNANIEKVTEWTADDIKMVYQNSNGNPGLQKDFVADTVLYYHTPPSFAKTDNITVTSGGTGTVPGRYFGANTGIKTESVIAWQQSTQSVPNYNMVSSIAADGSNLTLSISGADVAGVADKDLPGSTQSGPFGIAVPKIIGLEDASLYAPLPKRNVSAVNLKDSNLKVTKLLKGRTISSNTITMTSSDAIDASSGIGSCFFETFDSERYSVHYADGTIAPLDNGNVVISADGHTCEIKGLSGATSKTPADVQVTVRKLDINSKIKDYTRSHKINVNFTNGVSTEAGLTTSRYYGLRVEDKEISLNIPDVANVVAVYESTNAVAPTLDKLTFVSGLALDTSTFLGEKIIGDDSRAIAQLVTRNSATEIEYVLLNTNKFQVGEKVTFEESGITANIQLITPGSYTNISRNYKLDQGHNNQFADYSRLVRTDNGPVPSRRLMVICNYYKLAAGDTGDVFTANSYTQDRYNYDIPILPNNVKGTDILDFRPRVSAFTATDKSPFAFTSRSFEKSVDFAVSPNESSIIGYSYYLPRIDKITINKLGEVSVVRGTSADVPQPPVNSDDAMEVAEIRYPPYLYDPASEPTIILRDNRRFTMRDIGVLEKRIKNLEVTTSLSLLELDTKSLEVTDANGLNRFKTGFIVDNFENRDFIDNGNLDTRCDIDVNNKWLVNAVDNWSMQAELALDPAIDPASADLDSNLKLLDPNIQKTGDLLTLKYTELEWIKQPHATEVENVNPFNVVVFVGGVVLDPPSDNWVRTIYIDDHRVESTGAEWVERSNDTLIDTNTSSTSDSNTTTTWMGNKGTQLTLTNTTNTTTNTFRRSFTNQLEGPSREFDYVESVKISGDADPFMRSRNVYFNANGLKPFTKHFHYLDQHGGLDVFPKLVEIEMNSGTFQVFEHARVFKDGEWIGYVRVQAPNHKFGDSSRPDIGAGLGSPSVLVEKYNVDPYDRDRPAPSDTYSATSKLFNCGVRSLANDPMYFGYCVKGATIVGQSSGATATVTACDLISDNWGDIVGNFFFRDPNASPAPTVKVTSGTKTFKVTATPPGVTPLPGSTTFASKAQGTYTGTGTILTQDTKTVGVRNPTEPNRTRADEIFTTSSSTSSVSGKIKTVYRDPLAQSFTTPPEGVFLTSVDVYFASKDPNAKIFFEVREVELGTPTNFLVQDFAQLSLNPNDIQTSTDATIATNIKLPSPLFLEGQKEYAIVFLAPSSDLYEMWCGTMGQKTVKTSNLPDVQNVVVTKQYIGGSLFKSQNGTIWTPSQYQDLTFTLYKADFVESGSVTFFNSPIEPGNLNAGALPFNAVKTLPRKLSVPIANGLNNATLIPGLKVSDGQTGDAEDASITGIVEKLGSSLVSAGCTVSVTGSGYGSDATRTNVPLFNIDSNGTGAQATIVIDDGKVDTVTITSNGTGYCEGDRLGVTTANTNGQGTGAIVSVAAINDTRSHMYLTNVQGESFTNGQPIIFYDGSGTRTNLQSTGGGTPNMTVNGNSVQLGELNSGNVIEINQYNHAHHGANNKISIQGIEPDRERIASTGDCAVNDTVVSIASTQPFTNFEGITTSRGYALLGGQEIVKYTVGVNQLSLDERGLFGSQSIPHVSGSVVTPYEASGFSLTGINTTYDISSSAAVRNAATVDKYYIEASRTQTRSSGKNQVSFHSEKNVGGASGFGGVGVSQNHQFSSINPQFNVITPGKGTQASAQIRTISGTSAGGNEVSFIDQGWESVPLNKTIHFPTPRMVASKVNESEQLTTMPKNKSLSLRVDFKRDAGRPGLSPTMDIKNANFVLSRNKINNPIDDYAESPLSNNSSGDPHGSVFISKKIDLKQPATSLQVLIAANRPDEADFRVLYKLFKADSSEVPQSYVLFPGYDNLDDTDGDGFGDRVRDLTKNSGRADAKIPANVGDDFSEYQFTANDLAPFSGFIVKIVMSSTNESQPVKIKDFRALALA